MARGNLSPAAKAIIYDHYVDFYGETCAICDRDPSAIARGSDKPVRRLIFFHLDGDRDQWSSENLELRCGSCFARKMSRVKKAVTGQPRDDDAETQVGDDLPSGNDSKDQEPTTKCVCVSEDENSILEKPDIRRVADRRREVIEKGPEGALNLKTHYVDIFNDWFPGFCQEVNRIDGVDPSVKDVVDSGALVTGASQVTIRRYLDSLTSRFGPYEGHTDSNEVARIRVRDDSDD